MVVVFSAVVTREVGALVYVPLSLDRGILGVKSKFVGGVFYGPSYGFP